MAHGEALKLILNLLQRFLLPLSFFGAKIKWFSSTQGAFTEKWATPTFLLR
jgi:hypothetical protein